MMLNFIRADLWKLFRARSFYLTMVFVLAAMLLMGFLVDTTTRIDYETYLEMQEKQTGIKISTEEKVEGEEEYMAYQEKVRDTMKTPFFLSIITSESGVLYMAFSVFISLFALLDYKRGYMKNILAIPGSKQKWILSKLSVAAVSAIPFLLLILLGATTYGYLKTGEIGYTMKELIPFMGGQFIALMTIAAIQLLLITLFQSTLPTLILGLIFAKDIHSLIYNLIDNTNVLPFSMVGNAFWTKVYKLTLVTTEQVPSIIFHGILLCVVLTVITLIVSRKKDITC